MHYLKARRAPKHCTTLLLSRRLVAVEALVALILQNRAKECIVNRRIDLLEANNVSFVG